MASLNYTIDEHVEVLKAIDTFCMMFQAANFKGTPRSMIKQRGEHEEKPYFWQTVKDPETGKLVKYKVYY